MTKMKKNDVVLNRGRVGESNMEKPKLGKEAWKQFNGVVIGCTRYAYGVR